MTSLINTIPPTSTYKNTTSLISVKSEPANTQKPKKKEDNINDAVEVAAILGGVVTTLAYLLALAKNINKKNFKFTDIFHIDYDKRTHIAGLAIPFRVMGLATAALVGGMTAGVLADEKENTKPKLKEGIHQFLGNIIAPITIVGTLTDKINSKYQAKVYSKTKAGILTFLACMSGVCGGVIGGNYIATAVNNKLFNENDERKLHVKDFGIHIDDIITSASLSDVTKEFIEKIGGYALPLIFQFCGYEAGTKNVNSRD